MPIRKKSVILSYAPRICARIYIYIYMCVCVCVCVCVHVYIYVCKYVCVRACVCVCVCMKYENVKKNKIFRGCIYLYMNLYTIRPKSSKADQDSLIESDQRRFIFPHSLPGSSYTSFLDVAVLGSHW